MSHKVRLGAIIIIRNGAKTISYQTSFGNLIIIRNFVWELNNNKKRSKHNMSLKLRLGDIITSTQTAFKTQAGATQTQ